jgi:hypothetical protein
MPRCPKLETLTLSSTSAGFFIEQGSIFFNTNALSLSSLTIDTYTSTTSKGQDINTLTLSMSHSVILSQNSILIVTLPPEVSYTIASSCSIVAGLEAGASCSHKGNGVVWFENGMNGADRSPLAGSVQIKINSVTNPKGLGAYSIKVEVSTAAVAGCVYSRASVGIVVDSIPSMVKVSMAVSKTYRNSYETYLFDITPRTASIASGDKLEIVLPTVMSVGSGVSCQGKSSNLIGLSCSSLASGVLTLVPQLDSTSYSANQTISVQVKYLRNPDSSGLIGGLNFNLLDSTGKIYENYSSLSYTFENYVTPEIATVAFQSDRVGEMNNVTLSIKVPIRILSQSTIALNLSKKFIINSETTILSANSLQISLKSSSPSAGAVVLQVNSDLPENTLIVVSLNASNPASPSISPEDVKLTAMTPDSMQLFSVKAISNPLSFKCIGNCDQCFGHFSNCSTCAYGYYLSPSNACELQTKHNQLLPYFVFLAIAGLLFLFMLIYGKIFGQVNYWANRAFVIFKVDLFLFLIYFEVTFASNPVDPYLQYISYGIIGSHFIVGLVFFYFTRSPTLKPSYLARHVEDNGHMLSLTPEEEIEGVERTLEKRTAFSQNIVGLFGLLLSVSASRWFFGGFKQRKGVFWYHPKNTFKKLRIAFEVYELFYNLFVLLPLVGLSIFCLYSTHFQELHKYMLECMALVLFNILLYIFALIELLPVIKPAEDLYIEKNLNETTKINDSKYHQGRPLFDSTLKEQASFDGHDPLDNHLEAPLNKKPSSKLFTGKKSSTTLHDNKHPLKAAYDEEASTTNRLLVDGKSDAPKMNCTTIGSLIIMPTKGTTFQNSRTEKDEESIPIPAKVKSQKAMPDIKLYKMPEGTIRPKLESKPPALQEVILNEQEKEKQESALPVDHQLPIQIDSTEKDTDSGLKYTSQKTNLGAMESLSKIKSPEKSRFRDNQLFSKWWFNNDAKKYLEIVYEEEDDAARIQENLEYESKPVPSLPQKLNRNFLTDSKGNISLSDASFKSEKWPERYINGQLEQNLNKGILKDRNGTLMDLKQHKKSCFSDGVFSVPHLEDKIVLNAQNPGLFIKGLIRDVEGRLYRLIDQDFEMLKDGILLKRDGTIDNINGQAPEKTDLGIFTDRVGNVVDLKDQDPLCFDKNRFITTSGHVVIFDAQQDHNRFSIGLVRLPDGSEVRFKDQDLEELSVHGVYRDRDLNPLILPRKGPKSTHSDLDKAAYQHEGGELLNPVLNKRLYGKFERSKDSIASSRHGDSKRSMPNIHEQERLDTEMDTLHHYPMAPVTSNFKAQDPLAKGRASNRQSFDSFGPMFPLKHDPSKLSGSGKQIPQRRDSSPTTKPFIEDYSNHEHNQPHIGDSDPNSRATSIRNENPEEPVMEKMVSVPGAGIDKGMDLNDSIGNQSSNINYEQHLLKDTSYDFAGSQRLTKEDQDKKTPQAIGNNWSNTEKIEETASFARETANNHNHSKIAIGSKEKILDALEDQSGKKHELGKKRNLFSKNKVSEEVNPDGVIESVTGKHELQRVSGKDQSTNIFKDPDEVKTPSNNHIKSVRNDIFDKNQKGFQNRVKLKVTPEPVIPKNYDLMEAVIDGEQSDAEKLTEKEKQTKDLSFNSNLMKDPKHQFSDTLHLSKGSILPKDIQSFNSQINLQEKSHKLNADASNGNIDFSLKRSVHQDRDSSQLIEDKSRPDSKHLPKELPESDKREDKQARFAPVNYTFAPGFHKRTSRDEKPADYEPARETGNFNYQPQSKGLQSAIVNKDIHVPDNLSDLSLMNPTPDNGRSVREIGQPRDALDTMIQELQPKLTSGPASCLSRSRPNSEQQGVNWQALAHQEDRSQPDDQSMYNRTVFSKGGQESLLPSSKRSLESGTSERQKSLNEIEEVEPVKEASPLSKQGLQRQDITNKLQKEKQNHIKLMPVDKKTNVVGKEQLPGFGSNVKHNPYVRADSFKKKEVANHYNVEGRSKDRVTDRSRERSKEQQKALSSKGSNRQVKTKNQKEERRKLGSHRGLSNQNSNKEMPNYPSHSKHSPNESQYDNYQNAHPDNNYDPPVHTKDFGVDRYDQESMTESEEQPIHQILPKIKGVGPTYLQDYENDRIRRRSSPDMSKDHILNSRKNSNGSKVLYRTQEDYPKGTSIENESWKDRRSDIEESTSQRFDGQSDVNTMYLNLVLDESVEIDLDIEAVDDEESEMSRTQSRLPHSNDTRPAEGFNKRIRLEDIATKEVTSEKIKLKY